MLSETHRIIGQPRFGGILVVSDHASNHVPADIALGIDPALLIQHMALDIGVGAVGGLMAARPGMAAFQCAVSRLVCDVNRNAEAPGAVPEFSDGHEIPGNRLTMAGRAERLARFHAPYHAALDRVLGDTPPALILSLHSFTPALRTCDKPRPWQVGVLYNRDDRAARLAIPLLEAEGLCVGDQQPYSGVELNYTMNRHAEAEGRPYLGVEVRQDEIDSPAGQARWAERLARIASAVALAMG
ncbi:N-formylglutamate amidohydrolase [Novosphingobium bradum]|uniref:N-formylglutamate amidohydrolase n=1 Tax=Novosphingobium bradum TaxID=1737444 RepID=A0ABV7INE5_9SPHN